MHAVVGRERSWRMRSRLGQRAGWLSTYRYTRWMEEGNVTKQGNQI